jgi:hypothetical protein
MYAAAFSLVLCFVFACSSNPRLQDNTLTPQEKSEGWQLLFNGENLDGFHRIPGGEWSVEDGVIVGTSPASEKRHGLLVTNDQYSDFTVKVEYKALEGNSGLYFRAEKVDHVVSVRGFQAEIDADGNDVGGLYETLGRAWVIQPDSSTIQQFYKPGEWNTMTVTAKGRDITVTVNGFETASLENDPGLTEGYIALQLHGSMEMHVMFKNFKIKPEA